MSATLDDFVNNGDGLSPEFYFTQFVLGKLKDNMQAVWNDSFFKKIFDEIMTERKIFSREMKTRLYGRMKSILYGDINMDKNILTLPVAIQYAVIVAIFGKDDLYKRVYFSNFTHGGQNV